MAMRQIESSTEFREISAEEINRAIRRAQRLRSAVLVRQFRRLGAWLRSSLAAKPAPLSRGAGQLISQQH
jgi:hypothetical protein